MRIMVITRTRNEAANIDRFCLSYAWADQILIADGGSEDDTIQRAQGYSNVTIREYTERATGENGHWRNPHGEHINFLIGWAKDEGADWIIFDDCDCVPTLALQHGLREIMRTTQGNVIMLYRLYVYGDSQYFPQMNEPGQSLYAWRARAAIRARDTDPWQHHMYGWNPYSRKTLKLEQPLCCLHYYCPDEATIQRKLKFYRESGEQSGAKHPTEVSGELAPLPDWARWM